jgi:hypothetical protein
MGPRGCWLREARRDATMEDTTRFLIRSERSVVDHCRRLLAQNGLSESQAQRLRGLLSTAEAELERLTDSRHEQANAA